MANVWKVFAIIPTACWHVIVVAFTNLGDAIVDQYGWVAIVSLATLLANENRQWVKRFWHLILPGGRPLAEQVPRAPVNYRQTLGVAAAIVVLFLMAAPFQIYSEQKEQIGEIDSLRRAVTDREWAERQFSQELEKTDKTKSAEWQRLMAAVLTLQALQGEAEKPLDDQQTEWWLAKADQTRQVLNASVIFQIPATARPTAWLFTTYHKYNEPLNEKLNDIDYWAALLVDERTQIEAVAADEARARVGELRRTLKRTYERAMEHPGLTFPEGTRDDEKELAARCAAGLELLKVLRDMAVFSEMEWQDWKTVFEEQKAFINTTTDIPIPRGAIEHLAKVIPDEPNIPTTLKGFSRPHVAALAAIDVGLDKLRAKTQELTKAR